MIPNINRSVDYKINNTIFRVRYGDITQLSVDAIVSSDDNHLSMGGGVSEDILLAAGETIRNDAEKHTPLKMGDVVVTSAGRLKTKYIFHAVTIVREGTNRINPSEESIRTATYKCLQLADVLGIRVIAFPALGTGTGRFPFKLAAEVMTRTIAEYLMRDTILELVVVTLFPSGITQERDMNLFYERAASLASISTQSKQLGILLTKIEKVVGELHQHTITKRVRELRNELFYAQKILENRPENLDHLEQIQKYSGIGEISEKIFLVSSQTDLSDSRITGKELEELLLQTKLAGLKTRLNAKVSYDNRLEIDEAKYYGNDIPLKLKTDIRDVNKDILELEKKINERRTQLLGQKDMHELVKILFLLANPEDTERLRLGKEMRSIEEEYERAKFRDRFDIKQRLAVQVDDLQRHLRRHEPHIVHISGHGKRSGEIILEDTKGESHPVPVHALSDLFSMFKDNIRCVVLNACYSVKQAEAIAEHIDCVVGMSKDLGDLAAINFAKIFYQALFDGRNVKEAFDSGRIQIDMQNPYEPNRPELLAFKKRPEEILFV